MGLGTEPGEYTLTFAPSNRSGGFVSNQTPAGAGYTVEKIAIRQMDEVLKSLNVSRVDFVKIDVEGFEGQVLRGAAQTLATNRPLVVLELNHWCLNAFQRTSVPDFFDFLRSIFPILLAVDSDSYLDLHDESESYNVMYHHIIHMRFPNILAAFDESRLDRFRSLYKHQFVEATQVDIHASADFNKAVNERDQAAKERDLAYATIDKIFSSKSWRITAPIRRISGWLREFLNQNQVSKN
jgi:hypothetical protein